MKLIYNERTLETLGGVSALGIKNNELYFNKYESDVISLCFTAEEANCQVMLTKSGTPTVNTFEYSTNGSTWNTYTLETPITLTNVGDKMYLRNTSETTKDFSTSPDEYYYFQITGKTAASGDVTSLLNKNGGVITIPDSYCFNFLFSGCTELTTAPELPSTRLADWCYYGMFQGCTELTTAPALPATTLANICYIDMFNGCTSLTVAPALPATTLANGCYYGMFQGCTELTTAPALPAIILTDSCYMSMFQDCTSLTVAPALPATTLADRCYFEMFANCESLVTAPALPATTLADLCYFEMFAVCTSLVTAPALPATTLADYCYYSMFAECSSLVTAPALPATTLARDCYESMFFGCISLVTAPALPATTLADWCYYEMFYGCSSLSSITCFAIDISSNGCLANWVYGVSATGTFYRAEQSTDWTIGASGIPNGWTVVPPLPQFVDDFMFNFNFKEYDAATHTVPNTENANWQQDLVLTGTPNVSSDHITVTDSDAYAQFAFASTSANPFNRNNTKGNELTLIYKVGECGTEGTDLIGNRGRYATGGVDGYNWMLRPKISQTMLHKKSEYVKVNIPSTKPNIFWLTNDSSNNTIHACVGGSTVTGSQAFGNDSGRICFFCSNFNSNTTTYLSERFTGVVYWMFCANRVLTQEEIQTVINYNENL